MKCFRIWARYIGVLNVTFRKASKKRTKTFGRSEAKVVPTPASPSAQSGTALGARLPKDGGRAEKPKDLPSSDELPRIVSHSQQPTTVPQVIFENNRHIIPDDLFSVPPRPDRPRSCLPLYADTAPPRKEESDMGSSVDRKSVV